MKRRFNKRLKLVVAARATQPSDGSISVSKRFDFLRRYLPHVDDT